MGAVFFCMFSTYPLLCRVPIFLFKKFQSAFALMLDTYGKKEIMYMRTSYSILDMFIIIMIVKKSIRESTKCQINEAIQMY